jgi:hypothetical protein
MNESDTTFEEGDRVVLEDTHHAHNSGLKKCEGRKGTIVGEPRGYNDKYLVEFDGTTVSLTGRYWVAPKWLGSTNTDR